MPRRGRHFFIKSTMLRYSLSITDFTTIAANLAIWLANLPLSIRVHTTLQASVCRAMPFSARALKKHFLWRWYCSKKPIEMWFSVVCTLIDNECASLLFSQTFFSYFFYMLREFAKVFERKVWRVQVAHLHSAARALSSPSRCFQLSVNLDKDFFRCLWVQTTLNHIRFVK